MTIKHLLIAASLLLPATASLAAESTWQHCTQTRTNKNDALYDQHYFYYDADGNMITDMTIKSSKLSALSTYSYDSNGRKASSNVYSVSGGIPTAVNNIITYEHNTDGKLTKESTAKASEPDVLSNYYSYIYDDNGLLTERDYYTIPYNKTDFAVSNREFYTYDDSGRLIKHQKQNATGTTTTWTYEYEYEGDSQSPASALYTTPTATVKYFYEYDEHGLCTSEKARTQDSSSGEWTTPWNYSSEYVNTTYSAEYAPTNVKTTVDDSDITKLSFSYTAPAHTEGFKGVYVMVNGYVDINTLYTGTQFTLEGQTVGTHTYRLVPVYDNGDEETITSSCSDELTHEIRIALPKPTNPVVLTKEVSGRIWTVKFGWTAPETGEYHLLGYKWTADQSSGGESTDPEALTGTFKYYDYNVITVSLYAIYQEGESYPVTFDVDLSDDDQMVTANWHNYYSEESGADDVVTSKSHLYWTTATIDHLETKVIYSTDDKPLRRITYEYASSTRQDVTKATEDVWDAEAWEWKPYAKTESAYSDNAICQSEVNYIYDNDKGEYVETTAEVNDYNGYANPTFTYYPDKTSFYDNDVLTGVAKWSYDGESDGAYTAEAIVYASGDADAEITGKIEETHRSRKELTEKTVYTYSAGEYTPVSRERHVYSAETGTIDASYWETYADGQWTVERKEIFTPSKEYHSTHTATSLYFENDKVDWFAPSRIQGQLTGYTVLVDDVIYSVTDADTREVEIKDIPTGTHAVKVVASYNGTDASLSDALTIIYVYEYVFDDIQSAKAQLRRKPSRITGDVLLTGSFGSESYVEDATAGLTIVPAEGLNVKAGDCLRNIRGLVTSENGAWVMAMTSADVVSSDNTVTPTETTLKTLLESPADFDARLVSLKNVTFGDDSKDGDDFKTQSLMEADDLSLTANFAEGVTFEPLANVTGWLKNTKDSNSFNVATVDKSTGVEQILSDGRQITFADNVLTAEGCVAIDVYDLAGRHLLSAAGTQANLGTAAGQIVIARVKYSDGCTCTYKLTVK